MNSELPSESTKRGQSLDQRYADKPHLRQRLLEIADMIDELVAQGCTAHEAEVRAIKEIRKLGNGILTEWAEKSEAAAAVKARAQDSKLQPYRKKKL
jgi:endonuclease/exonuclease/phosphatase family metal-dependent hydrolase